jgi:hypothetical protein
MAPISWRSIGASTGLPAVEFPSGLCWESPNRVGSGGSDCSLARAGSAGSAEQLLRQLFPPQN